MRRRRRPRPAASAGGGAVSDINITPMVDVLLCLLIFTMVIQPGLLKGVDVQVPPPEPVGAAASAAEGRDQIIAFLRAKWERELDYALRKDLWAFHDNRIAVRFQYEWHDGDGQWFRSYGNENWEFDEHGFMRRREASINDVEIAESERRFRWAAPGPRPAEIAGLGETPL